MGKQHADATDAARRKGSVGEQHADGTDIARRKQEYGEAAE